nr:lasso peptide biosynthesis B2 protein [Asticcacaulis machinosus]
MGQGEPRCGVGDILEVCADVGRLQRHLRTRPLLSLLEATAARPNSATRTHPDIHCLALRHRRARRYSFIDTICLLDSLALLAFLRRRGHAAKLIFAVNLTPFGAHCWVEHDGIILNDTLGSTQTFQPIRIQ